MKSSKLGPTFNNASSVLSKYELIMFDFDGTLCETEAVDISAIPKAYQTLKQAPPSQQSIHKALQQGLVATSIFQYLSPHASSKLIQKLFIAYKAAYRQEAKRSKLFSGTLDTLAHIRSMPLKTIITSNKAFELLRHAVDALELSNYFDGVVGVTSDNIAKPDPNFYFKYVAPLFETIDLQHILLVGDTKTDVAFAKAIRCDVCWVTYGSGTHEGLGDLEPTYTISELRELLPLIRDVS